MVDHCDHCGMETEHETTAMGWRRVRFCLLCFTGAAWREGGRRIAGTPEWRKERDNMRRRLKRRAGGD
jgi:hypothetical protein